MEKIVPLIERKKNSHKISYPKDEVTQGGFENSSERIF